MKEIVIYPEGEPCLQLDYATYPSGSVAAYLRLAQDWTDPAGKTFPQGHYYAELTREIGQLPIPHMGFIPKKYSRYTEQLGAAGALKVVGGIATSDTANTFLERVIFFIRIKGRNTPPL